jgi:hypothetical protein
MDAGPGLVLLAGTMTFGNEWYQTNTPNWRVPIATLLGTAAVGAFSALNQNAATALGGIILVGAATAKFGGKSVVQELNEALNAANGKTPAKRKA